MQCTQPRYNFEFQAETIRLTAIVRTAAEEALFPKIYTLPSSCLIIIIIIIVIISYHIISYHIADLKVQNRLKVGTEA